MFELFGASKNSQKQQNLSAQKASFLLLKNKEF